MPSMADTPDRPSGPPPAIRIAAAKCARCGAPAIPRYRPFCSQRCAEIDLGSWFSERYRVAGGEGPDQGEDEGEQA